MNKEHGWPAPEDNRTGEEAGGGPREDESQPEPEHQTSAGAGAAPVPVPPYPVYGGRPGFAPPGFAPPGFPPPGFPPRTGDPAQGMPGLGEPGGHEQVPAGFSAPAAYGGPAGQGVPAGHGNGPGYGSYRGKEPGKGLAIAALCVAGFGLLFSWIWFLNFITFIAGTVALGLGIPALVRGIKAKNIALPLSITALSTAVVSMIVAVIINFTVQYASPEDETGYSQGEAVPGPMLTEAPAPAPVPSPAPADVQETKPPAQSGLPDRDYSADISGSYYTDIIEQPAASAGEGVQVGDYTVTLAEVDRDATAEVLTRDPSAGEPDHGYVLFEFRAVYNGSTSGSGTGRPDLDFTPKFIGADARLHSVLNCSMDLGVRSADRIRLAPGETGTYEICFDLPEAALGEDSRVGLRMILADRSEDVYWRLP